jgi:4-amino-4-deoxy-L-arabinose transferase-like glycosyltransferase
MSEAPSLPLEAESDLDRVSSRWKERIQSSVGLLLGTSLSLVAMGAEPRLPGGFSIGFAGVLLATGSALAFVSTFARPRDAVRELSAGALLFPVAQALAAFVWLWLLLRAAVAGVIPLQEPVLAITVPTGFIWLTSAMATAVNRLGFLPEPERPLWRRHGFWLLVSSTLVYLPMLGNFGLIDPWETHYGEVAREMLSRDDWISLWWAQDGWFWSKPISNFWTQGLSFAALGVEWAPDQMIRGVASGRWPSPEWAVRLPTFLFALVGQQLLYMAVRAYLGRLVAFLGALVLMMLPYWYMLAHQSMADMAYAGPMTAAMALILLALDAPAETKVRAVRVRLGTGASAPAITLSGYHLLFASVLLCVLPQVVYLLSRNVSLDWAEGPLSLKVHLDRVFFGSPGNCGLPGNAACRLDAEGSRAALQPAGAALLWSVAAGALLWLRRDEDRLKRLCYLGAWLFAGLSFMGKGAPGLVLVVFTFGGFLLARGRLSELRESDFTGFALLTASVVMPWFVQEFLRHGNQFFERLFIHDMYQRAFDHVHDTNKGDDTSFRYYVWQLGYGLFPFSGVAAAGTLFCLNRTLWAPEAELMSKGALARLADITYFCVLWLLAAFGMFAITGTKFHHYILPLVPALAVLTGVLLGSLLQRPLARQTPVADGVWALGAAVIVGLCGRDLAVTRPGDVEGAARLLQLFTYNYARSWPKQLDYSRLLWVFTALAVLACLSLGVRRLRRAGVLGLCGLGLVVSAWAVNVYLVQISPHWGQRETISEYYERRAGPEEPLVAYQLNWKGENFYTGNDVPAFVSSGKRFTEWVEGERKKGTKVMFFTTEHSRIGTLKRELPSPKQVQLLTDQALNDKFVLVRVVL